eukprot:3108829-Rhodomonas_salina.2
MEGGRESVRFGGAVKTEREAQCETREWPHGYVDMQQEKDKMGSRHSLYAYSSIPGAGSGLKTLSKGLWAQDMSGSVTLKGWIGHDIKQ